MQRKTIDIFIPAPATYNNRLLNQELERKYGEKLQDHSSSSAGSSSLESAIQKTQEIDNKLAGILLSAHRRQYLPV
jgi:hypothetical protein